MSPSGVGAQQVCSGCVMSTCVSSSTATATLASLATGVAGGLLCNVLHVLTLVTVTPLVGHHVMHSVCLCQSSGIFLCLLLADIHHHPDRYLWMSEPQACTSLHSRPSQHITSANLEGWGGVCDKN